MIFHLITVFYVSTFVLICHVFTFIHLKAFSNLSWVFFDLLIEKF